MKNCAVLLDGESGKDSTKKECSRDARSPKKKMNDRFDKNGLKMRDEMDEPAAMRRGRRRRKCGKGIT